MDVYKSGKELDFVPEIDHTGNPVLGLPASRTTRKLISVV